MVGEIYPSYRLKSTEAEERATIIIRVCINILQLPKDGEVVCDGTCDAMCDSVCDITS